MPPRDPPNRFRSAAGDLTQPPTRRNIPRITQIRPHNPVTQAKPAVPDGGCPSRRAPDGYRHGSTPGDVAQGKQGNRRPQMSYDPTGPYGPDPNYQQQPWQQPTEPQYGVPSPGPSYPPPQQQPGYPTSGAAGSPTSGAAGYPTSGGGAPPPPGYPQTGYLPTPPQGPKKNTALIITLVAVNAVGLCGGGHAVTALLGSRNKPDPRPTTRGATPPTPGTTPSPPNP